MATIDGKAVLVVKLRKPITYMTMAGQSASLTARKPLGPETLKTLAEIAKDQTKPIELRRKIEAFLQRVNA